MASLSVGIRVLLENEKNTVPTVNQRRYLLTIRKKSDSDIVNTDSMIVNTHSNPEEKVFTITSESPFTIHWNQCSRSIGMGVHDGSEYAPLL
jgi:hypothetical protein